VQLAGPFLLVFVDDASTASIFHWALAILMLGENSSATLRIDLGGTSPLVILHEFLVA
jgi:hypothetical protein